MLVGKTGIMDPYLTHLAILILAFALVESQPMPGRPGSSQGFMPPPPGPPNQAFAPPPPAPQSQGFPPRGGVANAFKQLDQGATVAILSGNDAGKKYIAFQYYRKNHPCLQANRVLKALTLEMADVNPLLSSQLRVDPMAQMTVAQFNDRAKRGTVLKAMQNPCFNAAPGLLALMMDYADVPTAYSLAMRMQRRGMGMGSGPGPGTGMRNGVNRLGW